jgi:hypothetical protein
MNLKDLIEQAINEATRVPLMLYPSDFRKYFSGRNYDILRNQFDKDTAPQIAQADNGNYYQVSSTYNRYDARVVKLKRVKEPK